jgi:hypothetical protein
VKYWGMDKYVHGFCWRNMLMGAFLLNLWVFWAFSTVGIYKILSDLSVLVSIEKKGKKKKKINK